MGKTAHTPLDLEESNAGQVEHSQYETLYTTDVIIAIVITQIL